MITQEEYNIVKQTNRYLHIKVDLLNYQFQKVDELSGTCIGTPTFSVNADSDVRRTCSFSLVPTDSSFDIKYGNKIWMDKYIKVFIGIESNKTQNIIYSNMGLYLINNPNSLYSSVNNTLSIQGIDLMAKLNGLRGGSLEGVPYVIPENSNIREAVISCLELAKIDNYIIEDYPITTPYEIKTDVGGTIYNILASLRDILPNYQIYFDIDGTFHFEQIPSGKNEQIFIDDDIWQRVLIDYSKSVDYSSIKNVIEVFGKPHEIRNFSEKVIIKDNIYKLEIPSVTELRDLLKIGFVSPNAINNPKIQINELKAYPILNEDKTVPILDVENQYYVFKFIDSKKEEEKYFQFMGKLQPHAIAKEENPNSPFNVNGELGELRIVLQGGDYDNIYTDMLAQERADWELYTRCKLKDSITINVLPVYWADVNKLISITLPNKIGNEETNLYIIKSINTTFGITGTQSIECMRYYPFYADYIRNLKERSSK